MVDSKLCVGILFVTSILGTARSENVVGRTDDEKGHLNARKVKSENPAISILSNGSLNTPGKGI